MRLTGEDFMVKQRQKEAIFLKDLIERSQEGDTQAMEALYKQYKQSFFSLIYRHTYNFEMAEDLLQDIFVKIFTNLGNLRKVETFNSWAYRITLNTCYSYLRSKKGKLREVLPLDEVRSAVKGDSGEAEERVIKKPLDEAIESLPQGFKSVFLLHDVQGFKHKEIAQILKCSSGTSKSQLFKARMKIRAYLRDKKAL
jgi:RNA polymerase sigma-70 factor (ECF subfamily)